MAMGHFLSVANGDSAAEWAAGVCLGAGRGGAVWVGALGHSSVAAVAGQVGR